MHHPSSAPVGGSVVGGHLRAVVCAGSTALCLAQAWAIVFVLRIGPVVAVIDARAGRGVHVGDALAILPMLAAAALSGMVWARTPTVSGRSGSPAPQRVIVH